MYQIIPLVALRQLFIKLEHYVLQILKLLDHFMRHHIFPREFVLMPMVLITWVSHVRQLQELSLLIRTSRRTVPAVGRVP